MPERGIQCSDPPATRALAKIGGITSCFRCLAFRPETRSGCFLVDHPAKPPPKPPPKPEQRKLFDP